MASELRLRARYKGGQKNITGIRPDSTIQDLQDTIHCIFGISAAEQKIKAGYPPTEVPLNDKNLTMTSVSIKSGETLIIEGAPVHHDLEPSKTEILEPQRSAEMRRHEVPADNHCLFYSIYFLMNEGVVEKKPARALRAKIANHVLINQHEFNHLVLDMKSPDEYAAWIQSDNSWGGSVELKIFSDLYRVEINAVDIMTNRIDRYNQGKFSQKVFLLYDGIHYDPLFWDSGIPGLPKNTVFQADDSVAAASALQLASVLQAARQFTDTGKFKIRCGNCGSRFEGDKEVAEHATKTGHFNFQEI